MSKPNETDPLTAQGDPNAAGQSVPGGNSKPPKGEKPDVPTIEEHARKLNIGAPVFAAVMQTNMWASGKRVPEEVFKKAVENFLGAPMGGIASKGGA